MEPRVKVMIRNAIGFVLKTSDFYFLASIPVLFVSNILLLSPTALWWWHAWGYLGEWNLNKMAAILADVIFKCISEFENDCFWIKISLNFVPKGSFDNKSALVQVMACCRAGNKPLPEPMLTRGQWVRGSLVMLTMSAGVADCHDPHWSKPTGWLV